MSTTKELIADLQMYAGDNGYGHIDYADTMRNAAAAIEALSAEVDRLSADLTKAQDELKPITLSDLSKYRKSTQDKTIDFVNTALMEAVIHSEDEVLFIVPDEFKYKLVEEVLDIFNENGFKTSGSKWILSYFPAYRHLFVNRNRLIEMTTNK